MILIHLTTLIMTFTSDKNKQQYFSLLNDLSNIDGRTLKGSKKRTAIIYKMGKLKTSTK